MLKPTAVATAALTTTVFAARAVTARRMGVSTSSYSVRWRNGTDDLPAFNDSLGLIENSHGHGAGGVQITVGGWTDEYARRVRERIEEYDMFLEGQIRLPRSWSDVERFDAEVRRAKEAGISIIRTVMLGGRRYENFDTIEAWNTHKETAWRSLLQARAIMEKHRVRLAVENHKDWRIDEMVKLMERIDSEWVGVNLDFGNNLSLLDDPVATIEALAPHTITTHFKDMAVEEYEDGFLLSEVPLGDGFYDLRKMIETIDAARTGVQHNLEMITRDPLKVPVFTDQYWVTFGDVEAQRVAEILTLVAKTPPKRPLPSVAGKSMDERVNYEEENVRRSFAYARANLGL